MFCVELFRKGLEFFFSALINQENVIYVSTIVQAVLYIYIYTYIVHLIMNVTNSERMSMSVPLETNGQDETTPEHVTVASVSLYALLNAKNLF